MTSPAEKSNELLEQLSRLLKEPQVNEFALQRIEREARALLKVDAAQAYMLLGIVNSMKGDVEATHENYQKALNLRDDLITRENYGNSLAHLELMSEALPQFDKALSYAPNPSLVIKALGFAVQSGHPRKAFDYYEMLVKLLPESQENTVIKNLMKTANTLLKAQITDKEMTEINALAQKVIKTFDVKVAGSEIWLDRWGDFSPSVVNDIRVHASVDQVVAMNVMLADLEAEADTPALRSMKYSISFYKARDEHPTH